MVYEVLWQPGTDHAAIATEVKVTNTFSVERCVDVVQTYIAVSQNFQKFIQSAYLVFHIYYDGLCDTVHISALVQNDLCFIRIIADHTENCEFRCIEACETIDVNIIICQHACHSFQTSRFVFYEYNVLFYHLFSSWYSVNRIFAIRFRYLLITK